MGRSTAEGGGEDATLEAGDSRLPDVGACAVAGRRARLRIANTAASADKGAGEDAAVELPCTLLRIRALHADAAPAADSGGGEDAALEAGENRLPEVIVFDVCVWSTDWRARLRIANTTASSDKGDGEAAALGGRGWPGRVVRDGGVTQISPYAPVRKRALHANTAAAADSGGGEDAALEAGDSRLPEVLVGAFDVCVGSTHRRARLRIANTAASADKGDGEDAALRGREGHLRVVRDGGVTLESP